MSIIEQNLMSVPGYTPYCGGSGISCRPMPRTFWNGEQFQCPYCGWASEFNAEFINKYKSKWADKGAK